MQSLYSHVVPKADVKFLKCFSRKILATDGSGFYRQNALLATQPTVTKHTHTLI